MDDTSMDLMVDEGPLWLRLQRFADARLTPELTASARMRARVLAVAHRQSALARADTTLALLSGPLAPRAMGGTGRPGAARVVRRVAGLGLAATLALGAVTGTALAAQAGGALYDVRVWAEGLNLPTEPSARAVAEIRRLDARLAETASASVDGDHAAASAALAAYGRILAEAIDGTALAGDPVALAAMEAGVARNIEVLTGLSERLSGTASAAIERAVQRAIEHSDAAIDTIAPAAPVGPDGNGDGNVPGNGNANGNANGGGAGGAGAGAGGGAGAGAGGADNGNGNGNGGTKLEATPKPTKGPTSHPTKKPDKEPKGQGKPAADPDAKPKPTPRGHGD